MTNEYAHEFNRIKKVIESCETQDQYDNAIKWARKWCMRRCLSHPNIIEDCNKLYEDMSI
jgi:hypothetical protein